jgi:hypothetical protein
LRASGPAHHRLALGNQGLQRGGILRRWAEIAAAGLVAEDVGGLGAGIGDVLGKGLELHQPLVRDAPAELGVIEHHAVGQVLDDGREHAALLLERELRRLERGDVADEGEELAVPHHLEVVLDPGTVLHARGKGDGAGPENALAPFADEGLPVLHQAEIAARDHVAQDVLMRGAGTRQLRREIEQLPRAVGILDDGAVRIHQDDDIARAAQQVLDARAAGGEPPLGLARLGDVAAEGQAPAGGRIQDSEGQVAAIAGLPGEFLPTGSGRRRPGCRRYRPAAAPKPPPAPPAGPRVGCRAAARPAGRPSISSIVPAAKLRRSSASCSAMPPPMPSSNTGRRDAAASGERAGIWVSGIWGQS